MFKYTIASVNKIVGELRSLAHVMSVLTALFMILYLTVACILDIGYLALNIVLLALTVANFVTYLVVRYRSDRKVKRVGNRVNHACKISKIFLNLLSLATVVYTVAVNPESVSTFRLVMLPLMIIMWVLQFALEVISLYIESRLALFVDGIQMDLEGIIKPALRVKNAVNTFIGEEEVDTEIVSARSRKILSEQAAEDEAKRERRKTKLYDRVTNKGSKILRTVFTRKAERREEEKDTANK